jgi:protein-L-isoaspartate(D-aspartate) O-methyltransferase (PCMT)
MGRRQPLPAGRRGGLELLAACPDVPPPLIEQLAARGRLIAPVLEDTHQRLTLREKRADGVRRAILSDVLYISLRAGTALETTRMPEPSHEGMSGLRRADRSATSSACSRAWRRSYDEQLSAPNREGSTAPDSTSRRSR